MKEQEVAATSAAREKLRTAEANLDRATAVDAARRPAAAPVPRAPQLPQASPAPSCPASAREWRDAFALLEAWHEEEAPAVPTWAQLDLTARDVETLLAEKMPALVSSDPEWVWERDQRPSPKAARALHRALLRAIWKCESMEGAARPPIAPQVRFGIAEYLAPAAATTAAEPLGALAATAGSAPSAAMTDAAKRSAPQPTEDLQQEVRSEAPPAQAAAAEGGCSDPAASLVFKFSGEHAHPRTPITAPPFTALAPLASPQ